MSEGEDEPPAPRCEWGVPDVMPGNAEAVRIWGRCRKQVIPGMNGPIDINVLAVTKIMDLYGVKNQKRCLEKVRILSDEYWAVVMEREHAKSKD